MYEKHLPAVKVEMKPSAENEAVRSLFFVKIQNTNARTAKRSAAAKSTPAAVK